MQRVVCAPRLDGEGLRWTLLAVVAEMLTPLVLEEFTVLLDQPPEIAEIAAAEEPVSRSRVPVDRHG